jgi:signal transduction histidine kinase
VFPLRGADGQFRDFLTRVEPVRDERGRISRWFGTNTDVTVQQEAERREKRARETAEALNRVGPVLAAELDPERLTQKITDIATDAVRAEFGALFHNVQNEAGESLVLYTLSGVDRDAFSRFPMPRNTHVFGPTFRGEGVVRSDDVTKDPRYGHNPPYHGMPEGHIPVRSYLAVPVVSRSGKVIGGLFFGHSKSAVFTRDAEAIATGIAAQAAIALDNASLFDETRRASEALRKSNEDLTRLNEDLNQFAYSASHDLREPLRMVSIYTQLLNRRIGPKLDEESSKYVEQVLKGASRLEALIRDLLAYTKAAELEDEQVPAIDAGEAFRNALANLSATIEETGSRVSAVGDLPRVCVAEVHFTQLLQNLIGNAIKYRSAAVPEIRIEATRRSGLWEFSVADNGIGIESDFKEQIFGIFKRLHNAEKYSGTGIGLAICQRIVQRYGGKIWVESEPGRGSTFSFTVPAAD